MTRRAYALLIFVLLGVLPAFAADRYVTQTGSGTMDGTSSNNSWSMSQFSIQGIPPGDTVNFGGDITQPVQITSGGVSDASRVTYNFNGATIKTSGRRVWWTGGLSYMNFYGGTITHSPQGGVHFSNNDWGGTNITVSGWTYMGVDEAAPEVFSQIWTVHNLLIENNNIQKIGIGIQTQRATSNVVIRNNIFISGIYNFEWQTDVLFIPDVHDCIVEGNKLVLRSPGAQSYSGGSSIRHNDVIQIFESGAGGHQDPRNYVIRYNWIEITNEAKGDGSETWLQFQNFYVNPSFKLYANVFVGNSVGANGGLSVAFQNGPGSVSYLYNNTMIRKPYPNIEHRFEAPQQLHSRNNLSYTLESSSNSFYKYPLDAIAASPWNNNFMFNQTDCYEGWTGAKGSCTTNPMFQSVANAQYWLAAGSLLIGKGDGTIGSEYSMGIEPGATWPNPKLKARTIPWDVGAYVSSGDVPPPLPNQPPKITVLQLRNGNVVLDPAQPITIKNVTIATAASDDTGLTWLQISVKGVVLKGVPPQANPTTMTTPWNTAPYKGKGTVQIEVVARDADGLEARQSLFVTVKK